MTDEPKILFDAVSKRFEFSANESQSVLESLTGAFSRKKKNQEQALWAVKDVSFRIDAGESLGIIGRNGSGKSTVLKLASGIIQPSAGRVIVRGRLSALLELGAGFHADLTGRENIFLNASILGMNQAEIDRCYQDIVEFSELGEFIHMPVKHYSSGMYMRLGFSVAVHVNPEILIIDEILAVGDQAFQIKCIDRIYDLKKKGTTIVFVSHNLDTVRNLCSNLIWLDDGRLIASGNANEVISRYREHLFVRDKKAAPTIDSQSGFRRWGSGEVEITGVKFLNEEEEQTHSFRFGDKMTIEISYTAHVEVQEPEFGLAIFRSDGVQVSGPNNLVGGLPIEIISSSGTVRYCLDELILLPATYKVSAAVHDSRLAKAYDFHEQAYSFQVLPGGPFAFEGLVDLPAHWEWDDQQDASAVELAREPGDSQGYEPSR